MEGDVDLFSCFGVTAELHCRAHDKRAVVVGSTCAFLGGKRESPSVCDDTGGDGGAVVSTPSYHHETDLADFAVDLELVGSLFGRGNVAVGGLGDRGGVVDILTLDVVVGVLDIGRFHGEEMRLVIVGCCMVSIGAIPVHGARP